MVNIRLADHGPSSTTALSFSLSTIWSRSVGVQAAELDVELTADDAGRQRSST